MCPAGVACFREWVTRQCGACRAHAPGRPGRLRQSVIECLRRSGCTGVPGSPGLLPPGCPPERASRGMTAEEHDLQRSMTVEGQPRGMTAEDD